MRFLIFGDVHRQFDQRDAKFVNEHACDAALFVGDLGNLRLRETLSVAEQISRIAKPCFVIPGNHDGPHPIDMLRESLGKPSDRSLDARMRKIEEALLPHVLGGYTVHSLGDELRLLIARPCSVGGPIMGSMGFLKEHFGVHSLAESEELLVKIVSAFEPAKWIVIAHQGPFGLGSERSDLWGSHFHREKKDWGDVDLANAIARIKSLGHQVLAVAAGHMHRPIPLPVVNWPTSEQRKAFEKKDGTLYINAANAPRWKKGEGGMQRTVVELKIEGDECTAKDVFYA